MRDDNEAFMNDKDGAIKDRKLGARKVGFKKKVCKFCQAGAQMPDYRNHDMLRRYITERGKILPGRITGTCAKHQRALNAEIKKARVLAYLPFEKK